MVRLPNASARPSALTVGCGGTLYAADMLGTQLARITPDGALDKYANGAVQHRRPRDGDGLPHLFRRWLKRGAIAQAT